jgi:uncharacterized protein
MLLAGLGRCAVALSGGQDSAFVLLATVCSGLDKVEAVSVDSAMMPPGELDRAQQLCRKLGVTQRVLRLDPLNIEPVRNNAPDRCYHCKNYLFTAMQSACADASLIDGTNVDDLCDYRPGRRALEELGIRSPLVECGFTKEEIAASLRELGIGELVQPPSACLATRFAYGEGLTAERLQRAGAAEQALHGLGFRQCRVRVQGESARIEVERQDIERLSAPPLRKRVTDLLRSLGYDGVSVDLAGYRTGSWNEALSDAAGDNAKSG